jgi:hypothetical protein
VVRTGEGGVATIPGLYCSYYENELAKPLSVEIEDAYSVVELIAGEDEKKPSSAKKSRK